MSFTMCEVFHEMQSVSTSFQRYFSAPVIERTVSRLVLSRFGKEFRSKSQRSMLRRHKRPDSSLFLSIGSDSCESIHDLPRDCVHNDESLEFSIDQFLAVALNGQDTRSVTPSFHTTSSNQPQEQATSCSCNTSDFLTSNEHSALNMKSENDKSDTDSIPSVPMFDYSDNDLHLQSGNTNYSNYSQQNIYDIPYKSTLDEGTNAFHHELTSLQIKSSQILKAITYATSMEQTVFSNYRIEAEKMLLITEKKINAIVDDFVKDAMYAEIDNQMDIGHVQISTIQLETDITCCKEETNYFFCLITNGTELLHSKIVVPDLQGFVFFEETFKLSTLPPDFKIKLEVYSMTIKNISANKLRYLFCGTNPATSECFVMRDSLFKLHTKSVITIKHINQPFETMGLTAHVYGNVSTSQSTLRCWCDVSQTGLFWSRRWCYFNCTEISYWNFDTDCEYSKPIKKIDLRNCLSIRIPARTECVRARTIILSFQNAEYYFSFTTGKDFEEWKQRIEGLFATLHIWNQSNCV